MKAGDTMDGISVSVSSSAPKRPLKLVDFGQCKVAKFSENITDFIRYLINRHCVYDPGWRYGYPEFRLQILIEYAQHLFAW
jgi:hypothetical protein